MSEEFHWTREEVERFGIPFENDLSVLDVALQRERYDKLMLMGGAFDDEMLCFVRGDQVLTASSQQELEAIRSKVNLSRFEMVAIPRDMQAVPRLRIINFWTDTLAALARTDGGIYADYVHVHAAELLTSVTRFNNLRVFSCKVVVTSRLRFYEITEGDPDSVPDIVFDETQL